MPRPQVLQPRSHKETGLGLDPFRSPLLRTSRLISLPPGTEMFQFPGFASSCEDDGQSSAGLPHSAISGSPRLCHSPELLAAYHGLHRLCVPRHPPHAFLRLTTNGSSRNTRVAIAIYLLPILCSLRGMPRRSHRLGKDSISHDLPPTKKTIQKVDDPSSVLHFSNSGRDSETLAVSLAL